MTALSKRMMVRHIACASLACIFPIALHAEVRLSAVFADHMVIQRDAPVHIWGSASAHESVTVTFRGEAETSQADDLGRWSLYLRPGPAGGPFALVVKGHNTISVEDVLAGDVWIASGQSNMEFPMAEGMNRGVTNEKAEIAAANYPRIRLLDLEPGSSDSPQSDVAIRHPWSACTPASVANFSAVGYFFARDLQQHEKVPIGVISAAWGGTPAEAWTSLGALSGDASLMPVFARRAKLMDALSVDQLLQKKEETDYETAKSAGGTPPSPPWHNNPVAWKPAGIYNAMVASLTLFPIKGVLWYQGESNADADGIAVYTRLFQTLINDWRNHWGQGEFPFLFVQIANWGPGELWPQLREAQRQALVLRGTAMAVTTDVGEADDIHPRDKQDVGARLALAARALAYGEQVEYSGPLVREVTVQGSALCISFDHVQSGLVSHNGSLRGFSIAGADGKYISADAHVDGDTVVVSTNSVSSPVSVRYGWAADPDANLYNRAGLPASPFQASVHNAVRP